MKAIVNNNEYFSDHYLNTCLLDDCKPLLKQWKDNAKAANAGLRGEASRARTPNERLKGDTSLRSKWGRARAEGFSEDTVRDWAYALLGALGYSPKTTQLTILSNDGRNEYEVPCDLCTPDESNPRLVAFVVPGAEENALETPSPHQSRTWTQMINDIFNQQVHPRWCLFIHGGCITLIDYNKWFDKKTLTFSFDELYGAQVDNEYKLTAALLHKDALCPGAGACLMDSLADNSHKNAYAVTTSLKHALQESIQILGNEYVWYMRNVAKAALYEKDTDAQAAKIAHECLRYMYRLLFCFYLESRPELHFLPTGAETYLRGYSVNFLRDCEELLLEDEAAQNGYFLDSSLNILFSLIYNGRRKSFGGKTVSDDFEISPLKSHLFDPSRTPLLSKVHFRNFVLQKVIRNLSLGSHGKNGVGRISYSSLGLNQLGAAYENLLAYSGFFAREELYEVKPAGEEYDPTVHAFFVTADELQEYKEDERAKDAQGHYIKHEKGEFIYRLAGRNRKNSASYYTPESLTKCTVQFALKELLKDKTADDILSLKVCEMAVGSAAFLNEAINQLAEAYLRLKQQETGIPLSPDDYGHELQRVKMFIADRNVVGVDLNETAVELAEVSLWLNTIHEGSIVPWFGMQLHHGNSLIGARRCFWRRDILRSQRENDKVARWMKVPPSLFNWQNEKRPANTIYHWLVPDEGMANDYFKGASKKIQRNIKDKYEPQLKAVADWRRDFMIPFTADMLDILSNLSDRADELWEQHLTEMKAFIEKTTDVLTVWPQQRPENANATSSAEKDTVFRKTIMRDGSPYLRLKFAMDYWCSLWFWPVEKAHLLPTREDFIMDMMQILNSTACTTPMVQGTLSLEADDLSAQVQSVPQQGQLALRETQLIDIIKRSERLMLVQQISEKQNFFHWELSCAHIFRERGGFDLIVGNPPWIKLQFEEADNFSEVAPVILVRAKQFPADRVGEMLANYLNQHEDWLPRYTQQVCLVDSTKNILNAAQAYPNLLGMQPNLYHCFITRSWDLCNPHAVVGFIHPDGHYTSPKAEGLRKEVYKRLRYHFQFENDLLLFAEIPSRQSFSCNIYGTQQDIGFDNVSNLFSTQTILECYDGQPHPEPPENIKTDAGNWSIAGHPMRIIRIEEEQLRLFADLLDKEGTPTEAASLVRLHTNSQFAALKTMAQYPNRIRSLKDTLFSTPFWDETNARKDGTIMRNTCYSSHVVLSGPHFSVANPFYQTPRAVCREKSDYDALDLANLPDSYRPRTNYVPACDPTEYEIRCPHLPWNPHTNYSDCYKVAFRAMLPPANERTLIGVLTCADTAHVNTVRSVTTAHSVDMLAIASMTQSLIGDYLIKLTGDPHLHYQWQQMPLLPHTSALEARVLVLNCLTSAYKNLWQEVWKEDYMQECWHGTDARLPHGFWAALTPQWQRNCALRSDFARRWALCELDVLVAREVGLSLGELCEAYRIQFPVLKQNEADTWYDKNGRIVFTCSKSLKGVGLDRQTWKSIKDKPEGFTYTKTYTDDTQPGGPVERSIVYEAPFDRRDREADYAEIWASLDAAEESAAKGDEET